MAKVVLDAISKVFPGRQTPGQSAGSVPVLQDINLTIETGEFLVLVGPSGCGKSTLLRLIAGLESPTAGSIWLGDRQLDPLPPKARDIAMVFQSYALYPHLTVYDNLAFGLRRTPWQAETAGTSQTLPGWLARPLVGASRILPKAWRYSSPQEQTIRQRVQSVAQMLQLEHLLGRLPKQLSGGQKQRVALGRAIARNPQVFLMDEPLSNLDAQLRTETRAQIVNLQRELGVTTIYVTHDQIEAMTMGHRIAVMSGGQIQQVASPLELYNQPANRFVAEFIGSPPMNVLTVRLTQPNQLQHPQFSLTLPAHWGKQLQPYLHQDLWLGVRPEHLAVVPERTDNCLVAHVERVEALGSETYLSCRELNLQEAATLAATTLQIRTAPDYLPQWGDKVYVAIAPDQIHLFRPEDGEVIRPSSIV